MRAEKPTATPWQIRGMSDCVRIERRTDAGYLNIARCGTTKPGPHETDIGETWANAEFIVRACNSYEQLVEALRNLLSAEKLDDGWGRHLENARAAAEKILSQVEGKSVTQPSVETPEKVCAGERK